jgi:TrmH family RNA methyltransferase
MVQILASLQNPLVKHLSKLKGSKAYREEKRRVLISGFTMIQELSQIIPIRTLIVEQEISIPAEKMFIAPPPIFKKITGLPQPEGALAEVDLPQYQDVSHLSPIVILDHVTDPGNLGTILRTALALGYKGAYIVEGSVDPFNDKALRSAKGATFRLPIAFGPIEKLNFPGTIYAADAKGINIEQCLFTPPFAIAFGNESNGFISPLLQNSNKIAIPLPGGVESLNVSAAAAISLYIAKKIL